jgi:adenylyltransferase/sulfurtransferase
MEKDLQRYHRQMILANFGPEGQKKLQDASVLVIGAGGLGCPALLYLAGAGVGILGIVDDDKVSLDNLHRQPLYSMEDIGLAKTERAAARLQALNPEIQVRACQLRLTPSHCLNLFPAYDIILDCTDNFATRYMINDACVLLNKPLVSGAVSQYEGQVAVFNCRTNYEADPVNYRDLFPEPPKEGEIQNCAEAGVIGMLPGIIGSIQAGETVKLITGIGEALVNRMLTYDMLTNRTFEMMLTKNPPPPDSVPLSREAFLQTDYEWLCGTGDQSFEIDVKDFDELLSTAGTLIIDVREEHEQPAVTEFTHRKFPLSSLEKIRPPLPADTVIFFCQGGSRSLQAARLMAEQSGTIKNIYSLRGGILHWKKHSKRASHV